MCSLWNGDFCVFGPGAQTTDQQMLVLMCAAEMMEITSAVWSAPLGHGRGKSGHFFVFVFIFIFIFSPFFVEFVAGEQNAVWTIFLGHWSSSVWIHGLYQKLVFQTWIKDNRDNNKCFVWFLGSSLTRHFIWNEEGEVLECWETIHATLNVPSNVDWGETRRAKDLLIWEGKLQFPRISVSLLFSSFKLWICQNATRGKLKNKWS